MVDFSHAQCKKPSLPQLCPSFFLSFCRSVFLFLSVFPLSSQPSGRLRVWELLLLFLLPHRRLGGRRERRPSLTPAFVENAKVVAK